MDKFKKNFFCGIHQDINVSRAKGFCRKCAFNKLTLTDCMDVYTSEIATYESVKRHLRSKNLVVREVDKNFNPKPKEMTAATTMLVLSECILHISNLKKQR